MPGVESVSLFTGDDGGHGLVGLCSDLDRDLGVGEQMVVPVRVSWSAAFGGEDEQAVAVAQIHGGGGVLSTTFGAGRGRA